ncbi:MAG: CPBP family intramembrane metalloprotease [Polyangiaceae bacterium]|nr:CPBP family intramembrane metalloprotease [Polyangiaceae bacterium]
MEQLRKVPLVPALFVALFAGVYEELAFRGFLLTRVRTLLGAQEGVRGGGREVAAVILSAVFFGLGHLYQGPLGVAQTLVAGLVLGAIAAYRRSIVASMVAHVAVDVLGFVALHAASR